MDAFAGDLLALMDALYIDRATVVGHSMGSFVARRAAERAPQRISRLVLVGTAMSPRNPVTSQLEMIAETLTDPVDEAFIREFQQSTLCHPVPPAFFEEVVAEAKKLPARVWREAIAGMNAYQPQWPITCPTTIIGGDRDAVFSADEQASVFLATEHSTLHIETGVGHAVHWEVPERFVTLAFPG
jgi:pimeloyl-ACP methyl ester carboxylesterase